MAKGGDDAGRDRGERCDEEETDDGRHDDGGAAEHRAEAATGERDAHSADLGRGDEPEAAEQHERHGNEQADRRADLRRDEHRDDGADDPDDLLRRSVEAEQGRKLARGHHLRVDRAHGGGDRGSRDAEAERDDRDRPDRHVHECNRRAHRRADNGRHAQYGAHAPAAHQAAGDRARDRLADALGGEHDASGGVVAVGELDVQQHRDRQHAKRESGGELGNDNSENTRALGQIAIDSHVEILAPNSPAGTAISASPPVAFPARERRYSRARVFAMIGL